MKQQIEYGCAVCKHVNKCPYNPFGYCKEFEQKEEGADDEM